MLDNKGSQPLSLLITPFQPPKLLLFRKQLSRQLLLAYYYLSKRQRLTDLALGRQLGRISVNAVLAQLEEGMQDLYLKGAIKLVRVLGEKRLGNISLLELLCVSYLYKVVLTTLVLELTQLLLELGLGVVKIMLVLSCSNYIGVGVLFPYRNVIVHYLLSLGQQGSAYSKLMLLFCADNMLYIIISIVNL